MRATPTADRCPPRIRSRPAGCRIRGSRELVVRRRHPAGIRIPRIGVDSTLETLGVDGEGRLDAPRRLRPRGLVRRRGRPRGDRAGDHRRPRRLADGARGVRPAGELRSGDEVVVTRTDGVGADLPRHRIDAVRQVGRSRPPRSTATCPRPSCASSPARARSTRRSATTPTTSSSSPRSRSEQRRRRGARHPPCIVGPREGVSRHRVSVITGAIDASPGARRSSPDQDAAGERLSAIRPTPPPPERPAWTSNSPSGSRSARSSC